MTYKSTEAVRRYRARNKEKVLKETREQSKLWARANPGAQKKWKEVNPEKWKEIGRRHTLKVSGWTIEDFDRVFLEQDSLCWICSVELVKNKGFKNTAHADHNHKNGKRRGILCAKCNMIEGHLSKSNVSPTDFIKRLLEYYQKFDGENKDDVPSVA